MAPPTFASGPMSVDHIPGRPIVVGLAGYEMSCPGCAFDLGKAEAIGKGIYCRNVMYKGLHVENRVVLEKPEIKPLATLLTTFDAWGVIPGRSIRIKNSPSSGFNVVCPLCAYYLGYYNKIANINIIAQGNHAESHSNPPAKEDDTYEKDGSATTNNKDDGTKKATPDKEDDTKEKDASATTNSKDDGTKKKNEGEMASIGKRTTAVMGNEGVAGINIKGEEIDIEIEAPPANPTTKPSVTLISPPINADDVVANNHGVAGINIEGTGKVKFVIGKTTK